jgi:hypothetical protein
MTIKIRLFIKNRDTHGFAGLKWEQKSANSAIRFSQFEQDV